MKKMCVCKIREVERKKNPTTTKKRNKNYITNSFVQTKTMKFFFVSCENTVAKRAVSSRRKERNEKKNWFAGIVVVVVVVERIFHVAQHGIRYGSGRSR